MKTPVALMMSVIGMLAPAGLHAQKDSVVTVRQDVLMPTHVKSGDMDLSAYTADEIKTQKLKESHKIIFVGDDSDKACEDSVLQMVSSFYVDQYRHFQDPLAPYFLLMSKDAKLAMGIGGCVRMRGWYGFDGAIPVNGFVPYMIPVPDDPTLRRRIGGTPDGTSIFMRVIGRNKTLGDVVGYLQVNFQGEGHTAKLKKAYVQLRGVTVGYTTSTFSDAEAEAPTIDGAGQNGKTGVGRMLVRWDYDFKRSPWSVGAALEMPSSQVDADGVKTKAINDWFPDIVAFGQYNWSHQSHIRLTGLMRVLPYRDLVAAVNRNRIGWGLQLSGVAHPANRLALYLEANTGQGYLSNMGDLSIGNYDLVASGSTPGELYAPFAMGLNVGAKFNFLPNLYAGLALAEARYFPRYEVRGTEYKYGLYGAVNLFYEPTPRLQVGVEYLIGARHNFNHEHSSANRVDALFSFSF